MSKVYQCPKCQSPDVYAGCERIQHTPLVRTFAGCKGCGSQWMGASSVK